MVSVGDQGFGIYVFMDGWSYNPARIGLDEQ
jgi:hypothetical protein